MRNSGLDDRRDREKYQIENSSQSLMSQQNMRGALPRRVPGPDLPASVSYMSYVVYENDLE
jgi:hypothetical protein